MPTSTKMKRRTVLRGMLRGAAVAIGLPPLEAMFNGNWTAHAADGSPLPRRLGVFFFGNGVRLSKWNPTAVGPGYPLSPSLMPLAAVRDYVNVVSGMDIKIPQSQGHHTGTVGILSGSALVSQPKGGAPFRSTFSAPSIDQVAAAQIGKSSRFKSLELGISRRVNKSEGTALWYLSHNGPDSANPPSYDPAAVFTRLFGGASPPPTGMLPPAGGMTPPPNDKAAMLRKSVLDTVMTDIDRLKGRVSTADRTRLDHHFEHIRSIERRIQTGTAGGAPAGGAPAASCATAKNPGTFPDAPKGEPLEEITTAMSQLVALALACDHTRVFSIMFSGSTATTIFWQVNISTGHHQLSHDEAGDQPQIQASTEYTMKMLAILLQTLKNTPEGPGNLLDSCAILASSDCSEGKSHSSKNYPIVVAGRGGGHFKYPGVHYKGTGENTNLVLMSLLRSVGLPLTEFGGGNARVTSGCSAIEA